VRFFGIAFPAGGNFFVVVAGLFQIIAAVVLKHSRLTAPNLSSPSTLFRLAPIFVFKSETGAGQSFAFRFRIQDSGFRIQDYKILSNPES
jgi:hypothetical protein